MRLVATEVQTTYRVVKPFRLPFHCGSMLRGVLGRALRVAGCGNVDAVCKSDCESPTRCTYARLFDPPVPDPVPHRFLRGQTKAPQPMIPLFPAPSRVDLRNGDEFSFALRILGPFPQGELATLLEMLEGMSGFDFGDEGGRVAFVRATLQGQRETPIVVNAENTEVERIEIVFETPAWLEHDGRLMEELPFQPLFRAIYRRLSILCALHGNEEASDGAQFARLDALAAGIVVAEKNIQPIPWQRRSLAREREHPMRGVLGRVVFEGKELGAFLPILRMAEKTHIGKATSFGLGRIRIGWVE